MSTLRASAGVGTTGTSVCSPAHTVVKSYPTAPCVYSSPARTATSRAASQVAAHAGAEVSERRPESLHDYLCAQTDVNDEVLQVYKLVCRS